jgi:23S rRNA (uracil1939-C5)-methyltransferase
MTDSILNVERLIWRGKGLARHSDGRVILLEPGVLPGETIRARVTKEKKDYLQAACEEIREPHPRRRPHPCRLADLCGGCRFGAAPVRLQLDLKLGILRSEMKRFLASLAPDRVLDAVRVFPSRSGWRYRWRGQVHVAAGRPHLMQPGGGGRLLAEDCLLLARPLAAKLPELSARLADGRRIIAASPADGGVFAEGDRGPLRLPFPEWGLTLEIPPDLFFQANWRLNRELVGFVQDRVGSWGRIADLFAGAGNFALPLAASGRRVLAVEADGAATAAARANADRYGLDVTVMRENLFKKDPAGAVQRFRPGAAVVDPPRVGGGRNMRALDRVGSLERLVWVSCDIVNTCRDVRPFLERGWRLSEVALFDMFPQTWHMETVLVLDRPGAGPNEAEAGGTSAG